MSLKNAYILDTETTSNDTTIAEVIELAMINAETGHTAINQRYKPYGKVTAGAMATHNIISADLEKCPQFGLALPEDCKYIIGHKIGFDLEVIENSLGITTGVECKGMVFQDVKIIDTLTLARVVFDDDDSHSQMACMYRLDPARAQQLAKSAHGALADVQMNKMLLDHLCREIGTRDPEILIELSELANIPAKMPFGKHKGAAFADLPQDYVIWYKKQSETDPWVIKAMNGAEALTLERAREIVAARSSAAQPAQAEELKPAAAPVAERSGLAKRANLLRPKTF